LGTSRDSLLCRLQHPTFSLTKKRVNINTVQNRKIPAKNIASDHRAGDALEIYLPVEKWFSALAIKPYIIVEMQIVPITVAWVYLQKKMEKKK